MDQTYFLGIALVFANPNWDSQIGLRVLEDNDAATVLHRVSRPGSEPAPAGWRSIQHFNPISHFRAARANRVVRRGILSTAALPPSVKPCLPFLFTFDTEGNRAKITYTIKWKLTLVEESCFRFQYLHSILHILTQSWKINLVISWLVPFTLNTIWTVSLKNKWVFYILI